MMTPVDAGFLVDHVASCGTGRDEVRSHDLLQRRHELFNRQLYRDFSVSVFMGEGAGEVNQDVDLAGLLHDAVEILVDGGIIEGVNDRRLRSCRRGP